MRAICFILCLFVSCNIVAGISTGPVTGGSGGGVTSITAGTGISTSGSTGNVTISATGTTANTAGFSYFTTNLTIATVYSNQYSTPFLVANVQVVFRPTTGTFPSLLLRITNGADIQNIQYNGPVTISTTVAVTNAISSFVVNPGGSFEFFDTTGGGGTSATFQGGQIVLITNSLSGGSKFASSQIAWPSVSGNWTLTFAHGLGVVPSVKHMVWVFQSNDANTGINSGHELDISCVTDTSNAGNGFSIDADAVNVYIYGSVKASGFANDMFESPNGFLPISAAANVKFKVYASP